jgi:hypothetical protein
VHSRRDSSAQSPAKVIDQVAAIFEAHGDSHEVIGDAHRVAQLARQAGV